MPHIAIQDKNLFYAWSGTGENILVFLHGNTVSSHMFQPILSLYERSFRVLILDFLGHGLSDRLPEFPADLWFDQAMQAATLLDVLELRNVNVIGSSGGALVALNLALERPELVDRVIADSFEGETALDAVASALEEERTRSKSDATTVRFWKECHGEDWETVVDNDTKALQQHHAFIKNFFHKDISLLSMPVLLTASLGDEFAEIAHFPETYHGMLEKLSTGKMHLFSTGAHPALLSNAELFAALAGTFFLPSDTHMP